MKDHIDTARFNDVVQIESLNQAQRAAVVALRKKAEACAVSPMTLGVLDTRDNEKLARLQDGKRLSLLSPSTREVLLQETRECVFPYAPAVVAMWSMWAAKNNVDVEEPEPELIEPPLAAAPEPFMDRERIIQERIDTAHAQNDEAERRAPKPHKPRDNQAVQKVMAILREELGDGQEHLGREIKAAHPEFSAPSAWHRARLALGVQVRLDHNSGGKGGKTSYWRLPVEDAPVAKLKYQRTQPHPGFYYATPLGLIPEIDAEFEAFAKQHKVLPGTLARWAEGRMTRWGRVEGETQLGLRESRNGVELADEVFQMCFPSMPTAVAQRIMNKRRAAS